MGLGWFSPAPKPLEPGRVIPVEILTLGPKTNVRAAIAVPDPPDPDPSPDPSIMSTPTPQAYAPEQGERTHIAPKSRPDETQTKPVHVPDAPEPAPKSETEPDAPPVFDLDALSGLIDRSRDRAPEKNQQVALESENAIYNYDNVARRVQGEGTQMSATEMDMLRMAMQKCWRMPAAAKDAQNLRVRLKISFVPGGHVEKVHLIDKAASRRLSPNNPYWDQAEREAIAAVHKCAPYSFLPDERFATWRELILNLRPQL